MGDREQKRKLVGPWRSLHTAVWVIGLAILAWRNWWWPGILVLVGISAVLEAVLLRYRPEAFENPEAQSFETSRSTGAPVPTSAVSSSSQHRFDLLPAVCPKCGGPTRGQEVRWTGTQSADCPYCGANLPMKSA